LLDTNRRKRQERSTKVFHRIRLAWLQRAAHLEERIGLGEELVLNANASNAEWSIDENGNEVKMRKNFITK
jgi:hypothetical protein